MVAIETLGNVDFLSYVLVVDHHGVFHKPFNLLVPVFLSSESMLVF